MNDFDPNKSIGFLIYEVSRLLRRDFDRRVSSFGLTQVQWRAITRVAFYEGCNQVTLAESLEIRPITLTRLIDRLEAAGWLERRPDPDDRRAVRLYLTEKARPLLKEMYEKALETRRQALQGIGQAECDIFMETLRKIKTNLG